VAYFSYHGGHSGQYCRHAKSTLLEVVERACELGFTHYGLSEHCPRFREQDLYSDERDLSVDDLRAMFTAYTKEAFELRERFADKLEIVVGLETERLPPGQWPARMRELRASGPFEYMVGSVHDIDGVWVDFNAETTNALAEQLGGRSVLHVRYFEAVTEMVRTLKPEVVGHLDLVRKFDGPEASIEPAARPHVEAALEAARDAGTALDVNCGAHRRGLSPVYPLPWILERACQMGVKVTLGDDSHGVSTVGVGLEHSLRAIADAGYRELHYLTRVGGVVQLLPIALEDVKPRA
jgi:histidinol-phosphatase (PHP family)